MKLFNFDPEQHAEAYALRGYVHVRQGLTPEYHAVLCQQVEEQAQRSLLPEFQLGGKQQALYDFPRDADYYAQLRAGVGGVTGLDCRALVVAERHIKAYEPDAEADPVAHKDRFASQVSVGFSVHVPERSRLILYPTTDVGVNPYHSWAELRAALPPQRSPERVLANAEGVVLEDRPGDVVMFRGSALWHKRSDPANAVVLYFKMNAFNCDTLGEDPGTEARREATRRLLALDDAAFARLVPELGRRVEHVQRRCSRDWQECICVSLAGAPPVEIDAFELAALRALDGQSPVGSILRRIPLDLDAYGRLRRLAALGVLDLRAPESQPARRLAA